MQIGAFRGTSWGHSRGKAFVGAVAAALALAVSMQGAAPSSVSAMPVSAEQCLRWWNWYVYSVDNNLPQQTYYKQQFDEHNCDGAVSGI